MTSTAVYTPAAPATARRSRLDADTGQLAIACVLIVLSGLVPDWLGDDYWTHSFQLVNLFIAVAAFQNLLMHDAGQTSFGQGAIFGVAAYGAAVVASLYGQPYWVAACFGVAAAVVAGFLYALPSLRVQGYYLGFVTMSAATVFPEMLVAANRYTNGINGLSLSFSSWHERTVLGASPMTLAVCGVACAALASHVLLRRTALGRLLRVAASSPEAAQSLGVSPGLMRCIAFTLVAFGTGVVGTLYTPIVGFVSPAAFNLDTSILFFLAVIVGGRGHILGTVVGVWVLYLLPNILLAELFQYRLLAYGAAALVVMLLLPDGIVGTFERWRRRRRETQAPLNVNLDCLLEVRAAQARGGGQASGDAIDVRSATKRYGSVAALDGVDLRVGRHQIHGLVGANGSGKTTLLNMLSGFSRLDSGSVRMAGREVTSLPAHRIARLGLGRTFQKPRIFPAMSLWENVEIGVDASRVAGSRAGQAHPAELIAALAQAMDGGHVDLVPHGQRRLVELMRVVLMGADIILLDEPAAGLSPSEREQFKQLLRRLRDDLGKTVVLVEHDLELVWDIADTITVLEAGKVVAHGSAGDIAENPFVRKLFIEPAHA
ncbi:branched-chain amino acid ABC transporter ATP-binding protein/permease [Variovorax sp. GB1P17]|uniref:branched-chain amino acid ABC transporter ATP-binding protein/permease n=1 Tax=Variovorax sp. GB1P17 TaxID=3443740 RepID=UPI003F45795C